MTRERLIAVLPLLIVFLLPWQTRWIFSQMFLRGEHWEYGLLSLYVTEALIFLTLALRGWPWGSPKLSTPLRAGLVFLGACFIAVALGENAGLGAGAMLHVGAAYALFLILVDERLKTTHIVTALLSGLALPALFGWYQLLVGESPAFKWMGLASHAASELGASVVETTNGRVLRAYGPFPHPNIFGGWLAASLLLIGWLARQWHTASWRMWLLPFAALFSGTLIATFSRSAWLATATGFGVLFALLLWYRKAPPRRALPLVAVSALAVLVTLVTFHTAVFTRFQPSARLEARSITERTGEWSHFVDIWRRNPFSGVGPGNYTLVLSEVRPGEPAYGYQPLHNVFGLLLAELGLLGLGTLAAWIFSIDRLAHAVARTSNGMFALGLGCILLVAGFFDHYLWSNWAGLSLAAVCFALMLRWSLEGEEVS